MYKELVIKSVLNVLQKYKKVVIVTHVNPDGDALGSSLALYLFLKKIGCTPKVIVPNDFPAFLSWMPYIEDVVIYDKNTECARTLMCEAELFCYLDFNVPSRTGIMHNDLCRFNKTPKILIDHHIGANSSDFVACYSETNISSTSEMVAEVVMHQGVDKYIDTDIATNLLVGMITDTGSFSHSVFENTFKICGDLLTVSGVNYRTIHQNIYDNSSENRLRLLGFLINNRMEVLKEFKTAFIYASKQDLEMFDYQVGDTEGVVNYPLSISDVKMSVLITERQGVIRLSFRSKGDFSVDELARKYFNGGGHLNAAGGTLNCSLTEAIESLKSVLPEYKEMLSK